MRRRTCTHFGRSATIPRAANLKGYSNAPPGGIIYPQGPIEQDHGADDMAKKTRTSLILAQAAFISLMAVIGAYGDSNRDKACPLPASGAHHCATVAKR